MQFSLGLVKSWKNIIMSNLKWTSSTPSLTCGVLWNFKFILFLMTWTKSQATDIATMQCLPMVGVDMNWCEINIWDFGIANKIRSKFGCPLLRVDSQSFWVIRTIKTFKSESQQMVLVNRFDKSWHFFYPLLQFYVDWVT